MLTEETFLSLLGEDWRRELSELEDAYDDYAADCECGLRHVETCIEDFISEMNRSDGYNYIDTYRERTKEFDSVVEKLIRRNLPLTIESIKNHIRDIAGIRIIARYRDDVDKIVQALQRPNSFVIEEIKDYVSSPKPNGYRSVHMIVKKQIWFSQTMKEVPVEIQIRSMAMDLWASHEHYLYYKGSDVGAPRYQSRLSVTASLLDSVDSLFIAARDDVPTNDKELIETLNRLLNVVAPDYHITRRHKMKPNKTTKTPVAETTEAI